MTSLPVTEQENPNTRGIDRASTLEAVRLINEEDKKVASAVERILPLIAGAIDRIVERLRLGGRLFYVGTGTSGRLGVLDASEIPPTYGVSYDLVQGVIAGGYDALYKATEATEDDRAAGRADLEARGLKPSDSVVGIAASGRTPYTIGALDYARQLGCFTACVTCVPESPITRAAEAPLVAVVGPEPITGSTRMKSGTAQKMILNMISTTAMIRLGYVKGNRMTNVKPSNEKLRERSLRIVIAETGLSEGAADRLMAEANGDPRVAIVMHRTGRSQKESIAALERHGFVIAAAIGELTGTG
jgi:N-acetylmuramic acid 6-phosphate etherase